MSTNQIESRSLETENSPRERDEAMEMPNSEPEQGSGIRIRWEVPLPWLLGGLAVICIQAAIVYFGQIRQAELLTEQSNTVKELVKQVKELSVLITANNIKDIEHDLKLADHERRLSGLEKQPSFNQNERR